MVGIYDLSKNLRFSSCGCNKYAMLLLHSLKEGGDRMFVEYQHGRKNFADFANVA